MLAYAHYAQERPQLAREVLSKLNSLATEHFFQKQVEFKATHLQRLVGADFEESYRAPVFIIFHHFSSLFIVGEVSVAARSETKLWLELPKGTAAQWDFLLSSFSIDFKAVFVPESGEMGRNRVEIGLRRCVEQGKSSTCSKWSNTRRRTGRSRALEALSRAPDASSWCLGGSFFIVFE